MGKIIDFNLVVSHNKFFRNFAEVAEIYLTTVKE